jgi:hypothetical protein
MRNFIYVLAAIVLTSLVWISVHFCLSERIRVDRMKAGRDRDAAYNELYELKAKFADKNRVPKYAAPRYKDLLEKRKP